MTDKSPLPLNTVQPLDRRSLIASFIGQGTVHSVHRTGNDISPTRVWYEIITLSQGSAETTTEECGRGRSAALLAISRCLDEAEKHAFPSIYIKESFQPQFKDRAALPKHERGK